MTALLQSKNANIDEKSTKIRSYIETVFNSALSVAFQNVQYDVAAEDKNNLFSA